MYLRTNILLIRKGKNFISIEEKLCFGADNGALVFIFIGLEKN